MSLQDKAFLVSLNISVWSARKHDKRESADLATRKQAAQGTVLVTKHIIAKEALESITKAASQARQDHYRLTLPWGQDGSRILPAAAYWEYKAVMLKHEEAIDTAADAFAANYPAYYAQAKIDLNGLFDSKDYPAPWKVRSLFKFDIAKYPLPDAGDWRAELTEDEEARIKRDITERIKNAEHIAMKDLWSRLYAVLGKFRDSLSAYTGSRAGRFNDTLVTNVTDLLDILPLLNVTDDERLTQLTEQLKASLSGTTAQTFRDSDTLRASKIEEADSILANMAGYVG